MSLSSLKFLLFTIMMVVVMRGAGLWAQASGDPKPTVADAKPATTDTLRQLEADFMNAAAERGADGYMSYYAEDAIEVPNGADAIHGKANIAKTMGFLNDKNNQLGRCRYFYLGRFGMDLRHLRISFERQGRKSQSGAWQVHQHLEETAGRELESSAGYGECERWKREVGIF
jgi:hypothetical protein